MRRPQQPEPVPSPDYQVRGDNDGPLPASLEQMEALQHFGDVLNMLPDPIAACVDDLTDDDVRRMLRSLSLRYRGYVLDSLNMPRMQPRNVSERLGADVRGALGRARPAYRREVLTILTSSAWEQLVSAVARRYAEHPQHDFGPLEDRWHGSVLRSTVWANLQASIDSAYVWQWAAEQSWWLPAGLSSIHGDQVRAAARDVVALQDGRSPSFAADHTNVTVSVDERDGLDDDVDEATDDAEVDHDLAPRIATMSTGDVATEPAAAQQEEAPWPTISAASDTASANAAMSLAHSSPAEAEIAASAVEQLTAAVAVVREHAATAVLAQLTAGGRPHDVDLAALTRLAAQFDSVAGALEAAGEQVSALTVAAVYDSLNRLRATRAAAHIYQQQQQRLSRLLTLTQRVYNETVAVQVETVAESVRALLATEIWDPADHESADALDELSRIVEIDPGAAGIDMAELADMQTRAMARLPVALVMSAVTGQLRFSDEVAPTLTAAPDHASTIPLQSISLAATGTGDAAHTPPELSQDEPAPEPTSNPVASPDTARTDAYGDLDNTIPGEPSGAERIVADRAKIGALISGQRYGTAAVVADRFGFDDAFHRILTVAALTDAARSETGPCASALLELLNELSSDDITENGVTCLLAVPALLRAAIVTGQPAAGALLTDISSRLESNLGAVAAEIGRRAVSNIFAGGALRRLLSDVPALERRVTEAQDSARAFNRTRRLRFARATDIAKRWLAHDGLLGTMLEAAANNDIKAATETAATMVRLSDPSEINRELDTIDRTLRGRGGKPLDGAGRHDLVNLVTQVRRPISAWVEAVLAVAEHQRNSGNSWAAQELSDMRTAVLARADAVLDALEENATDPLLAAAARAAASSLPVTFALLDGDASLSISEPPAALVLTGELLKVEGATVQPDLGNVALPEHVGTDTVLAAVERPWDGAVRSQVRGENYHTARYILDLAATGQLPGCGNGAHPTAAATEQLRGELDRAEKISRDELSTTAAQLSAELRRARLQNEVSEEQDGELTSLLADANAGGSNLPRRDLATVRKELTAVAELLPDYREQAGHRLTARLDRLGRRDDIEHIKRLIEAGELSTAEELIYYSEIGQPMPTLQSPRTDLADFFPSVPLALPDGITDDVIAAVRAGQMYAGTRVLDFSALSSEAREDAAGALLAWRTLRTTPAGGRARIRSGEALLPVLRLIGVEARGAAKDLDLQKSKDRRFWEVGSVTINGKAMVPAFGSKLGGRLRTLLVWGEPTEELLLSYADHDRSGESLLVLYFGTLSPDARRKIARRALRTAAPVVVLDDAAMAYLAAHGDRQFDATMAVTLPFSNVNPYVRVKRGPVSPEMFYGRTAERNSVLDVDGTQLIFGGRGLGKSALLRSSAEQFETETDRLALYLDLNTIGIGPTALTPDALWDTLLRELIKRDVITVKSTGRSRRRTEDTHEAVRAGILSWLEADSRRRLLVLLDESDRFFESDAPNFLQTNRLKEIGQSSEGRAKVVFAGLHTVQRFAKANNNVPFSHLGRPTAIGPLSPQFAYNLVVKPMEALGYVFDQDNDLVNRILGYCSYQPFLLQMFAHRLIEVVLERRRGGIDESAPPYRVTRVDVESVESDPHLRTDITSAFRDTLNLDARYNVIANVLAHNAHENGMDDRLNDVALRNECLTWWPDGFSRLSVEHFRSYLYEMVGLGVLAPNTGTGWHLRSPNVLRMIGPPDDVVAELVSAASASVPESFIALETRPLMSTGHCSPLTAAQIDDLLGDHTTQTRLVLGSKATGVADVFGAVTEIAESLGSRYQLATPRGFGAFKDELVAGKPGERRIVMSELFNVALETCTTSVDHALKDRPSRPGVTRSAILIAGPDSIRWWQTVLSSSGPRGLDVTTLTRYDARTLKVWSLTTGKFTTEDKRARLLRVTGGWPALVEMVAARPDSLGDEHSALADIQAWLATPTGAATFCDMTGLVVAPDVESVFSELIGLLDQGGTIGDVVDAVAMAAPHVDVNAMVEVLLALGVLAPASDEKYRCDPIVVSCWPHRNRLLVETSPD